MKRMLPVFACAMAIAFAYACGKSSPSPSAPSAAIAVSGAANPDGSTLKVSQPTLVSPINGFKFTQGDKIVLNLSNAKPLYAANVPLSYRFELSASGGGVLQSTLVAGGPTTTSLEIDGSNLEGEKTYQWRARAEYQGIAGPWSGVQSFIAPQSTGYIHADEIYDPLINGTTVGTIHGSVTFIPGVGVQINGANSWIEYTLGNQITSGEYSLLVTNLSTISATEDPKWTVMSMAEAGAPFNDNAYRMSVDKRGNGAIAWRFISGNPGSGQYIETFSAERLAYPFHESLTYFVEATWRDNFFNVLFQEGGVGGTTIYNYGKGYNGVYQPYPHVVYIGRPWNAGERGEPSSVDGEIVRQVWVSTRPRPAFANK